MYCRRCGTLNDDASRQCVHCGDGLQPLAPPPAPTEYIPNYLVPAILVTLFCCLPFGIAAIVYAAQVDAKLQAGDVAGARDASQKAKTWV
jgi:hypothetical protein